MVNERSRLGDRVGDTVRSKGRSALVTLVGRKSLQVVIQEVERATAEQTAAAITKRLGAVAKQVATITFDNGKEFACHKQIAEAPGCEVYFARPCHNWEQGTNENMNGMIRQYFPKGTDFDQVTNKEIAAVERRLNMRPRLQGADRGVPWRTTAAGRRNGWCCGYWLNSGLASYSELFRTYALTVPRKF